jgi:carbohydrate kinase (thermoresistant glucokinase family)
VTAPGAARPAVIVMGVTGVGKTTVARALASRLSWLFAEGDRFHPKANIDKMRSGQPLDDADRAPWLAAIGRWLDDRARAGEAAVISCSALKRAYRDELRRGRPQVRIVYLHGAPELIAARIAGRHDHFMPPALLGSQLHDLEPPAPDEGVLTVEVDQDVEAIVAEIVLRLKLSPESSA